MEGGSVRSRFASKMTSLGFELPEWCVQPSEQMVSEYEARFALALPADYREFLFHHGGVIGAANCEFQEPTPFGAVTCIDSFYGFTQGDRRDNVTGATELIDGAPDVVAIGSNLIGSMFWLKCSGRDRCNVYMHDHEGRFAWPDKMFHDMFSNLDPVIKDYLALRNRGKLPEKPKGYEHVYRLAVSFEEFIERLEQAEE